MKTRVRQLLSNLNFRQKFRLLGGILSIFITGISLALVAAGTWFSVITGSFLFVGFFLFAFGITRLLVGTDLGLQGVHTQLAQTSDKMLNISSNASESSFSMSQASTKQSTAVFLSVSNMEEMESCLTRGVKHSAEAMQSSEASLREAVDGKLVIDSLNASMSEIEQSIKQLEAVNQLVHEIGQKTKVINDIVFKTQLLSFNASIEAARAGEHGHGFAVVASEVGKLAEVSGDAAKDISKLLSSSEKRVSEIVESTKQKVIVANGLSQTCTAVFERIIQRADQVKITMNLISEISAEQEAGMQKISQTMNDLRSSAGDTNKMAHAISQLSGDLRTHSQALAGTLENFNGVVHGVNRPVQPEDETRKSA